MGLFGLIGDSLTIAGLAGSKQAADLASMFSGSLDITIGTAVEGVLGTMDANCFGPKRELIITGKYSGFGPIVGQLLSKGGFTTLLGLSGRSVFTLGRNVNATFGGPVVEIRHGPRVEKSSILPPDWRELSGSVTNPFDPIAQAMSTLPGYEPADDAGTLAQADAESRMPTIRVLCTLLSLTTLALELALRFGYPNYDPSGKSKQDEDPFSTPSLLDSTLTRVPSSLMGILYLYDMLGTWQQLASYCASNAMQKLNVIWEYTTAPFIWTGNALKSAFNEIAKAPLWLQLMVVFIIVMLVIIGLILGGVIT